MGIFDRVKRAYTLAEIIIVLVVIAVVVAVTMRVAKTKLDNITTYTYYSAYGVLNDVTAQMLADFNPSRNEYIDLAFLKLFLPIPQSLKVNATNNIRYDCAYEYYSDFYCNEYDGKCNILPGLGIGAPAPKSTDSLDSLSCPNTPRWYELSTFTGPSETTVTFKECPGKFDYTDESKNFFDYSSLRKTYDYVFDPLYEGKDTCSALCPNGNRNCGHFISSPASRRFVCGHQFTTMLDDPYSTWPRCQFEEAAASCQPPSEGCPSGTVWRGEPTCSCVSEPPTIPRKGINFCEMFVSLANTKAGTMCHGGAVAANTTDFSDITEDIILRNGMKIYNASQNPDSIADLVGNDTGGTVTKTDGTTFDTNIAGYTLYVDIDGSSGESKLWEDVFPFYVTLSGKVIPAYKTDAIAQFGGGSRYYLQTSLQVDSVDAQGATQFWLDGAKSISFRQAACMSGYVGAATQYCSRTPAVTESATCSEENNSCSIKKVSPIRWF